jgi:hypothetical protein
LVRVAVLVEPKTKEEYEKEVTLADGPDWSECVLMDMENANWHTAQSAFTPLIRLLPDIYKTLDSSMKKKLQRAVDNWDSEF